MNQLSVIENKDLLFEPANLTKETIKKYLCPAASDQELMMGLQIAKTFNLNPLKREVYFVKYGTSPMQVLVGYEVYLKRAERSGKYNGLEITSEGSIKNGDLKAVVKVYRKDWTNPLTHEAYYTEYVQTKQDGTPNKFWASKPITMIKKVAVSQAFRMAFPDEFDGMPYTSDEVMDQEKIIDLPKEVKIDSKALENEVSKASTDSGNQAELPLETTIKPKSVESTTISAEHKEELIAMGKIFFQTPAEFKEWLKVNFSISKVADMNEKQFSIAYDMLVSMENVDEG